MTNLRCRITLTNKRNCTWPPKTVQPSKLAEYSVGWICAQQHDYAAACALLDDEHGMPAYRRATDSNTYILGSIGGHNVVIACLPAGTPGAAPAAVVAANMQRTFRDVRVGLLVGVGSGASSAKDDTLLGDDVDTEGSDQGSSSGDDGNKAREGRRHSRYERTRCFNSVAESRLQLKSTRELRVDDYALRRSQNNRGQISKHKLYVGGEDSQQQSAVLSPPPRNVRIRNGEKPELIQRKRSEAAKEKLKCMQMAETPGAEV